MPHHHRDQLDSTDDAMIDWRARVSQYFMGLVSPDTIVDLDCELVDERRLAASRVIFD